MEHITDGIRGKVVAITGASSGIGAATARLLSDRGASVVLGARRMDRILEIAESIRSRGGSAVAVETDVTRPDDLHGLVGRAVDDFGRLDVLVNNAGIAPISRVDEINIDQWTAMVDVNLRGVMHGTAAALPVFQRQGHGHIVTMASLAGIRISPTMAVYAATKNAVRTFMEGLRTESTDGVVRTTTISPGFVQTELAEGMPELIRDQIRANMHEFGITPGAVARTIAFAIEQPEDVEISTLTIAPTRQG